MEKLFLATMIEKPVFSCSVGVKKPDPRIYLTYYLKLSQMCMHLISSIA